MLFNHKTHKINQQINHLTVQKKFTVMYINYQNLNTRFLKILLHVKTINLLEVGTKILTNRHFIAKRSRGEMTWCQSLNKTYFTTPKCSVFIMAFTTLIIE